MFFSLLVPNPQSDPLTLISLRGFKSEIQLKFPQRLCFMSFFQNKWCNLGFRWFGSQCKISAFLFEQNRLHSTQIKTTRCNSQINGEIDDEGKRCLKTADTCWTFPSCISLAALASKWTGHVIILQCYQVSAAGLWTGRRKCNMVCWWSAGLWLMALNMIEFLRAAGYLVIIKETVENAWCVGGRHNGTPCWNHFLH